MTLTDHDVRLSRIEGSYVPSWRVVCSCGQQSSPDYDKGTLNAWALVHMNLVHDASFTGFKAVS